MEATKEEYKKYCLNCNKETIFEKIYDSLYSYQCKKCKRSFIKKLDIK